MNVFVRALSTGAPRKPAVELLQALREARLSWDIDFYWFKSFCQDPLNEMFAEARKTTADFIILLHDDVGLEQPLDIAKLPALNLPMVNTMIPVWQSSGAMYWNCYHLTPDEILFSVDDTRMEPVEQIYQSCLAMTCYRRDVIDAIKQPFQIGVEDDGTLSDQGGADVRFCRELHRLDIPIYTATEIRPWHLRTVELQSLVKAFKSYQTSSYGLPSMVRKDCKGMGFPVSKSYQERWRSGRIHRPQGI